MNEKQVLVSFIIVSYNSRALTIQTLKSIFEFHDRSDDTGYEVIVVDNNSSDDTEYFVKSEYPSAKWIQSGANIGFGRANNLGVKHSIGEYLLFINSDTIVSSDIAREFLGFYLKHNQDCILGARLVDINGNPNTSFCRAFPGVRLELGNLFSVFRGGACRYYNSTGEPIFLNGPVSGACFFMKKSTFNSLNGFDEDYFLYYEETDLFFRANKIGIEIISLPEPSLIHLEGGSENVKSRTLERSFVSKGIYFSKNVSKGQKVVSKLLFYINAFSRLIYYKVSGDKEKLYFWLEMLRLERKYV